MEETQRIDNGKAFDWGKTSADYAKYRDIYPQAFYDKIISRGLCVNGQRVLDIGTGTGVLQRNMYRYGASSESIAQKGRLHRQSFLQENIIWTLISGYAPQKMWNIRIRPLM